MIEYLHHVQLAMPPDAEDQAPAFYIDTLGFEEVEKPAILSGRGGVWFTCAGVELHLEDPFTPAKKAHPAFCVASLEQAVRHLQNLDVSYRAAPSRAHGCPSKGVSS